MTPKKNNKRTMLIMLGLGAGALLLVMMLRRKSSGSSSESEPTSTYTTSPATLPATGETGAGEIARYESALAEQLPRITREGVEAGLQGNAMGQTNNLPETLTALGSFISAINSTRLGEQVGAGIPSPSVAAPTTIGSSSPTVASAPAAAAIPQALGPHQTLPLSAYPEVNPADHRHYRTVLFGGKEAHEYFGVVPGGLGPHKDIIPL